MEYGLKAVISADIAGAVASFNQFSSVLSSSVKDAQQASVGIISAFKDISNLKIKPPTIPPIPIPSIPPIPNIPVPPGLDKIPRAANQAGAAINDFSRVLQDAPFGFIGIQNNIGPLIESFTRLKASTGSTKAAISSLLGSLGGAGGLGLAVSAVVAAISFAQLGLSAWTRGFGDNKKAVDEHKEAITLAIFQYDLFQKKLKEVIESASQEAAKVTLLATALGDANTPLTKRREIIEELAKVSPKYLGDLDTERAGYDKIKAAVDGYIESLAKQSQIKALLPEFEGIMQKIIKAQVELNELQRTNGLSGIFGDDDQFMKEQSKRLTDIIRGGKREIEVAKKALADIAGGGESLVDILYGKDIASKDKKPKVDKPVEVEVRKLSFNPKEVDLTLAEKMISRSGKDFTLEGLPIVVKPTVENLKGLSEKINTELALNGGLTISPSVTIDPSKLNAAIKGFRLNINELLASIGTDLAVGVGEAVGNALSGEGLGDALSNIALILSDAVKAIGKQFIAIGVAMIAAQKSLSVLLTNPVTAIVAGVALTALSQVLKNSVTKKKFAQGGIVTGPTNALIGEAGQPEVVFPLSKLNQFLKGTPGGMNGESAIGNFILRGQDLLLSVQRTQKQIGGTLA